MRFLSRFRVIRAAQYGIVITRQDVVIPPPDFRAEIAGNRGSRLPDSPLCFRKFAVVIQDFQQLLIDFQKHPFVAVVEQRDEFFALFLDKAFVFVGRVLDCIKEQLPVTVESVDFRLPPAALQDSHGQPEGLGDFPVIGDGAVRIAVDAPPIGFLCGAVLVRHILNSAFTPTVRFPEIWEKVFRIFLLLRFHLQLNSQIPKYLSCRIPRHIGQFPVGNNFPDNRVHGNNRILHIDPALMIQRADLLPVFQFQHFT